MLINEVCITTHLQRDTKGRRECNTIETVTVDAKDIFDYLLYKVAICYYICVVYLA